MTIKVQEGQCGLCAHFGEEEERNNDKLIQIRQKHEAPETFKVQCGHPTHSKLHLLVTATSRCDGYEPASIHQ